jgi:hypothetical protein
MSRPPPSKPSLPPFPEIKEFCLSVPIFEEFRFDDESGNPFFALEQFEGTLDFFCVGCRSHSVFSARKNGYSQRTGYTNYFFT